MEISDVEKAWLAGIMDGEGSFGVFHASMGYANTKKDSTSKWRKQIRPYIQMNNTSKDLCDRYYELIKKITPTGVSYYISSGKNRPAHYKETWNVQVRGGTPVGRCLIAIKPMLIAKSLQASLLLEYIVQRMKKRKKHGGFYPYDKEDLDLLLKLQEAKGRPPLKWQLEILNTLEGGY